MNTSTQTLSAALVALFGAIVLMFGQAEVTASPEVVKLERVVIVGKRASPEVQLAQRIEQLPRVVIDGRRVDPATLLASAKICKAPTLC